jgi:hypothetical protein
LHQGFVHAAEIHFAAHDMDLLHLLAQQAWLCVGYHLTARLKVSSCSIVPNQQIKNYS